jgi:uncharacterized protein YndB with AHSA1/START domain
MELTAQGRGRYVEHDGRPAVRFERTYPHSIDRVWAAISEPEQLAKWFPSSVAIDPRVGGEVVFSGDPNVDSSVGEVLRFDPPHHLAFTWGADELFIDLVAVDDGSCLLVLINVLAERDAAARNAAGWTVCLGELDNLIRGESTAGPHSAENVSRFTPLFDAYVAAGLPAGAAIPAS